MVRTWAPEQDSTVSLRLYAREHETISLTPSIPIPASPQTLLSRAMPPFAGELAELRNWQALISFSQVSRKRLHVL